MLKHKFTSQFVTLVMLLTRKFNNYSLDN